MMDKLRSFGIGAINIITPILRGVELLRLLFFLVSSTWSSSLVAAEGGYSNYIPGTYGDFGVALAPDPMFITIRQTKVVRCCKDKRASTSMYRSR
jgi:hypothetical protein